MSNTSRPSLHLETRNLTVPGNEAISASGAGSAGSGRFGRPRARSLLTPTLKAIEFIGRAKSLSKNRDSTSLSQTSTSDRGRQNLHSPSRPATARTPRSQDSSPNRVRQTSRSPTRPAARAHYGHTYIARVISVRNEGTGVVERRIQYSTTDGTQIDSHPFSLMATEVQMALTGVRGQHGSQEVQFTVDTVNSHTGQASNWRFY